MRFILLCNDPKQNWIYIHKQFLKYSLFSKIILFTNHIYIKKNSIDRGKITKTFKNNDKCPNIDSVNGNDLNGYVNSTLRAISALAHFT